jgi:hypothetical protein
MPKALEQELERRAASLVRKGKLKSRGKYKTLKEARNAYIYGTMRETGWKPSRER